MSSSHPAKAKLEIALFLQDCVEEKAKKMKKSTDSAEKQLQSKELYKMVAKVRLASPHRRTPPLETRCAFLPYQHTTLIAETT